MLTSQAAGTEGLPRQEDVPLGAARGGGRLTVHRLATSPLAFLGTWLYMRNLTRWFATHLDRSGLCLDAQARCLCGGRSRAAKEASRWCSVPKGPERPATSPGKLGAGSAGRSAGAAGRPTPSLRSREISARAGSRRGTIRRGFTPCPTVCRFPRVPGNARPNWRRAPRAIFVGRLAPEKGLACLDRRLASGSREPIPTARLILAGEGPERPALEAQARISRADGGPGPERSSCRAPWPM